MADQTQTLKPATCECLDIVAPIALRRWLAVLVGVIAGLVGAAAIMCVSRLVASHDPRFNLVMLILSPIVFCIVCCPIWYRHSRFKTLMKNAPATIEKLKQSTAVDVTHQTKMDAKAFSPTPPPHLLFCRYWNLLYPDHHAVRVFTDAQSAEQAKPTGDPIDVAFPPIKIAAMAAWRKKTTTPIDLDNPQKLNSRDKLAFIFLFNVLINAVAAFMVLLVSRRTAKIIPAIYVNLAMVVGFGIAFICRLLWKREDYITAGAIIRRKTVPFSSSWKTQVLSRTNSTMFYWVKQHTIIVIGSDGKPYAKMATAAEADFMLRAWMSPCEPPTEAELADFQ